MSTIFVRKSFLVTLLAVILFFSGCASYFSGLSIEVNKVMESWVGKHQSDLILAWGPPQQTTSDGKGGSVLVYSNYVNIGQTSGRATTDYYGNVNYTAPQQQGYQRTRMFYVDPQGYIYTWRWQGI